MRCDANDFSKHMEKLKFLNKTTEFSSKFSKIKINEFAVIAANNFEVTHFVRTSIGNDTKRIMYDYHHIPDEWLKNLKKEVNSCPGLFNGLDYEYFNGVIVVKNPVEIKWGISI